MNFLRRILATILILSVLGLHFPKITLAAQSRLFVKAVGITEHLPEILAPPEEEIPVEEVKKRKAGRGSGYWAPRCSSALSEWQPAVAAVAAEEAAIVAAMM